MASKGWTRLLDRVVEVVALDALVEPWIPSPKAPEPTMILKSLYSGGLCEPATMTPPPSSPWTTAW